MLPFLLDAGVVKRASGIDISELILKSAEEYLSPADQVWCQHIKKRESLASDIKIETTDIAKWRYEEGTDATDWVNCPKCQLLKPKPLEKAIPDIRSLIDLKVGDVRRLDFPSESFDAALSFECLQHLQPEEMKEALAEMVRVSKKAVICVERWGFPGERFEPHYFSHNLAEQFYGLGLNVAQVSVVGNGMQGAIALKKIPK